MVTTERLYLGKSEIEHASYAQLQDEVMRLRGELQRLIDAAGSTTATAEPCDHGAALRLVGRIEDRLEEKKYEAAASLLDELGDELDDVEIGEVDIEDSGAREAASEIEYLLVESEVR